MATPATPNSSAGGSHKRPHSSYASDDEDDDEIFLTEIKSTIARNKAMRATASASASATTTPTNPHPNTSPNPQPDTTNTNTKTPKLILIHLDALLDGRRAVLYAVKACFTALKTGQKFRPPTDSRILIAFAESSHLGTILKKLGAGFRNDKGMLKWIAKYSEVYSSPECLALLGPYEDARDFLKGVKRREGVVVVVMTSGHAAVTAEFLEQWGMLRYVDKILAGGGTSQTFLEDPVMFRGIYEREVLGWYAAGFAPKKGAVPIASGGGKKGKGKGKEVDRGHTTATTTTNEVVNIIEDDSEDDNDQNNTKNPVSNLKLTTDDVLLVSCTPYNLQPARVMNARTCWIQKSENSPTEGTDIVAESLEKLGEHRMLFPPLPPLQEEEEELVAVEFQREPEYPQKLKQKQTITRTDPTPPSSQPFHEQQPLTPPHSRQKKQPQQQASTFVSNEMSSPAAVTAETPSRHRAGKKHQVPTRADAVATPVSQHHHHIHRQMNDRNYRLEYDVPRENSGSRRTASRNSNRHGSLGVVVGESQQYNSQNQQQEDDDDVEMASNHHHHWKQNHQHVQDLGQEQEAYTNTHMQDARETQQPSRSFQHDQEKKRVDQTEIIDVDMLTDDEEPSPVDAYAPSPMMKRASSHQETILQSTELEEDSETNTMTAFANTADHHSYQQTAVGNTNGMRQKAQETNANASAMEDVEMRDTIEADSYDAVIATAATDTAMTANATASADGGARAGRDLAADEDTDSSLSSVSSDWLREMDREMAETDTMAGIDVISLENED